MSPSTIYGLFVVNFSLPSSHPSSLPSLLSPSSCRNHWYGSNGLSTADISPLTFEEAAGTAFLTAARRCLALALLSARPAQSAAEISTPL
mmetsp:Transcript_1151/g.2728  ORF Transcript_1151/g.2728 Transcript_1151/m.2728 type:complete len:90 (-) Transcript_1151:1512-1781(-)